MKKGFSIFILLLLVVSPLVFAQTHTSSSPLSYDGASIITNDSLSFTSGSDGASIKIDSLSLVNAENDTVLPGYSDLVDGVVINRSNFPVTSFNIYAHTAGLLDSVVFTYNLNGEVGLRKETDLPYALKGDGAAYISWAMDPGGYFISAQGYANGVLLSEKLINFEVTDEAAYPFDGLYLIDADTDLAISGFAPMPDDALINLNEHSTSDYNIEARVSDGITLGSVIFSYDSLDLYQTDNLAPYAIGGDVRGDFTAWQLEPGPHKVTATAYSETNGTGDIIGSISLDFMVGQSVAGTVLEFDKLSLGPNPFKTSFWINFDDLSQSGNIRIYNALGQMVEEASAVTGKSEFGADLPRGIYIVVLETSGGQRYFQVLKQ